jgi:hypothetical protein
VLALLLTQQLSGIGGERSGRDHPPEHADQAPRTTSCPHHSVACFHLTHSRNMVKMVAACLLALAASVRCASGDPGGNAAQSALGPRCSAAAAFGQPPAGLACAALRAPRQRAPRAAARRCNGSNAPPARRSRGCCRTHDAYCLLVRRTADARPLRPLCRPKAARCSRARSATRPRSRSSRHARCRAAGTSSIGCYERWAPRLLLLLLRPPAARRRAAVLLSLGSRAPAHAWRREPASAARTLACFAKLTSALLCTARSCSSRPAPRRSRPPPARLVRCVVPAARRRSSLMHLDRIRASFFSFRRRPQAVQPAVVRSTRAAALCSGLQSRAFGRCCSVLMLEPRVPRSQGALAGARVADCRVLQLRDDADARHLHVRAACSSFAAPVRY